MTARHLTPATGVSPGDEDSIQGYARATREYVDAISAAIRAEYDRLSPRATRADRPREEWLLAFADACAAVTPGFDPRLMAKALAGFNPERAADFADMADALDRRAAREQAPGGAR